MPSPAKPSLSIGDAISRAMTRTGEVLFSPFRFKKWMAISLGAALTLLGDGGMGFNFSGGGRVGGPAGGRGGPSPFPTFDDAMAWIRNNIILIIVIATVIVIILSVIYFLVRWLNCRGQFMFFDNVVNNDSRIKAPWNDFREIAYSLFKFRIIWDLVYFNVFLVLLIIGGAIVWPDVSRALTEGEYHFTGWTISAIIFAALSFPLAMLALWIPSSVIFHMAVPVMYIRRTPAWPTIKQTWRELFRPNIGPCLLYFLMMIVARLAQSMWAFIAIMVVLIFTCCTAYCALLIPGVGVYLIAFLSLPVLTFERAFKLHFISQFGEAYRVAWQFNPQHGFPVILNESPIMPPQPPPPPV